MGTKCPLHEDNLSSWTPPSTLGGKRVSGDDFSSIFKLFLNFSKNEWLAETTKTR